MENQHHQNAQPSAKPGMSAELTNVATDAGKEFAKGMAKEGGKEAMAYEKEHAGEQLQNAQQQLDDAKAKAQGMFQKYCGCFSG